MPKDLNTPWRLTASTIYEKPTDSKIFGGADFDITELEKFIVQQRKEGLKVTITHLFTLAVGKALKEVVPEFNTYVRRGKIIAHEKIASNVSVLLPDGTLGSVKIDNVDSLNLKQLVEKLKEGIQKNRSQEDGKTAEAKNLLAKIPWPFRKPVYKLIKHLVIGMGFSFPSLGLSANTFGSYTISNIGTLGLHTGYPSLMPMANMALVMIIGGKEKRPVVINDEIVIRTMLNITVAFDHRVADASHGGKLFRYLKETLKKPELL